jgi:[acyl-carrier-protein] S-malonyltransferase
VDKACEVLKARGRQARALPLPVSAPFHSSLMKPAAEKLRGAGRMWCWLTPAFPWSTTSTWPCSRMPTHSRRAVPPGLWPGALGGVCAGLKARGITHVVECGPGKVLAGMVKRIDAELTGAACSTRPRWPNPWRLLA